MNNLPSQFPIVKPIDFLKETEDYKLEDLDVPVFNFTINDSSSWNSDYFGKKVKEMIYSMLNYEEIFKDFETFQEYFKKNILLKKNYAVLVEFFEFQRYCCFEIYCNIHDFMAFINKNELFFDREFVSLLEQKRIFFAGRTRNLTNSNYKELFQKSLDNKQKIFEETKAKDETSFHCFLEILEKLDETIFSKWNRIKYKLCQFTKTKEILLKLGEN